MASVDGSVPAHPTEARSDWDQNCLETTLCSSGLGRAVCVSGRAAVLAAIGVNNKRDTLMSSAAHFLHAEPFQRYISVFT